MPTTHSERIASLQPYAHSLDHEPEEAWEKLPQHLIAVGRRVVEFAAPFGWGPAGEIAGRLHDLGKFSDQFQAYIRGRSRSGGDHSTAGAVDVLRYGPTLGRMLAFCIAGHHTGLANGTDLEHRLNGRGSLPSYDEYAGQIGALPDWRTLRQPTLSKRHRGFTAAFLIRMLFSCLADADFLETERFYAESRREPAERGGYADLGTLRDRLRAHMAGKRANGGSALHALRTEVLDHAIAKASEQPGLFTLTVPTGGGKTLASLSFALEHAVRHRKRRIVYVIPFTSIIEQTAAVFREALGTTHDILEHHASFDWENGPRMGDDEEGRNALGKLRLAAENWDAPIVVTTAVQFFESLFAAKPARCRKLHNLADAVIVLDEAQTLPLKLLRPCIAALDELARNYGSSVVLCTATQPNLREQDDFADGLDIPASRELAPDPAELYARLKRVSLRKLPAPVEEADVADRFTARPQMLCIVNNRARARALYDKVAHLEGAARAQDAAKVGDLVGILPAIAERERDRWFPFADIAAAFRMIEDGMVPVVVPWQSCPSDRAPKPCGTASRPARVRGARICGACNSTPCRSRARTATSGLPEAS